MGRWPVVRLRSKCHAKEVDGANRTQEQDTKWSRIPVQERDTIRSIAQEACDGCRKSYDLCRSNGVGHEEIKEMCGCKYQDGGHEEGDRG